MDVVVFQEADRAVDLQHADRDLVIARDPVLVQGSLPFIRAHRLAGHVGLNDLAVVNHRGPPLNELAEAPVRASQVGNQVVQQQQDRGRDRPPSSYLSGPVIAFCTELRSRRKRVRSNGVICPTSRLPLSRTLASTRM